MPIWRTFFAEELPKLIQRVADLAVMTPRV